MRPKFNYYKQSRVKNQPYMPTPIRLANGANIPINPRILNGNLPYPRYANGYYKIEQIYQPNVYVNKPKNLTAINGNSQGNNNIWRDFCQVQYSFPQINYSKGVKRKPLSSYDNKRPKENLQKGQNQLILEKLQAKYSLLSKEQSTKLMPRTGVDFFKKSKREFPRPRQRNTSGKNDNSHISNQSKNSIVSSNTIISGFPESDNRKKDKDKDKDKVFNILNMEISDSNRKKQNNKFNSLFNDIDSKGNTLQNSKKNIFEKERPLTNRENLFRKNLEDIKKETNIKPKNEQNKKGIDLEEIIKPISAKIEEVPKPKIQNINDEDEKNSTIRSSKHIINESKSSPKNDKENILENNSSSNRQNNYEKEDDEDNKKERKRASSSYFNMSNINVAKIINQVFENNRKAAAAQAKPFFSEIGKDLRNNHMRKTQGNFFNPNGNNNKYPATEQEAPKTLNSIDLKLMSPLEWRKHEEIWANVSSLTTLSNDLEKHLIPPNDNDVLVSSYIKLFPSVLNFCSIGNICTLNQMQTSSLSLSINDRIQNPKLEMKKWKDAYKRVVLRWHPDKLFGILNEMKLKDESKRALLRKKSTIIINNMNILFKQIMEILKKITLSKGDTRIGDN